MRCNYFESKLKHFGREIFRDKRPILPVQCTQQAVRTVTVACKWATIDRTVCKDHLASISNQFDSAAFTITTTAPVPHPTHPAPEPTDERSGYTHSSLGMFFPAHSNYNRRKH